MFILLTGMAIMHEGGPNTLVLLFPWSLMVGLHLSASPASLVLALFERRHLFAAFIALYLTSVGVAHLHWFGVTEQVAEQAELKYVEHASPADFELIKLLDERPKIRRESLSWLSEART
jgi:hypothetical protein